MERNQYVFLLFSLSVLFQYIEIFQFSRIDADTMDIKYEMINVISFRDFLDTLLHACCMSMVTSSLSLTDLGIKISSAVIIFNYGIISLL